MLVGGWMQLIEDAGSGDERAQAGWEEAFALTESSGALVLRHENRAKSLALGQSVAAGVGKQQ